MVSGKLTKGKNGEKAEQMKGQQEAVSLNFGCGGCQW